MGCSGSNEKGEKKVIFVIGGPYSGKEMLCPRIQQSFSWKHLELDDIINRAKEQGNNVQTVNEVLRDDLAVPSDKLCDFMKDDFLSNKYRRILLEDFPKNSENLKQWNEKMYDFEIPLVFYFKCSPETMLKRMEEKSGKTQEEKDKITVIINSYEKDMEGVFSEFLNKGLLVEMDGEKEVDDLFNDIKEAMVGKGLIE